MITIGDLFWMDINIRGGKNVYAIPINLVYPADAIEVQLNGAGKPDVVAGEFLGTQSALIANFEQDQAGRLVIGYSKQGVQPESSGDGLLCSVRCKALTDGTFPIQLGTTKILNGALQPMNRILENFSLDVIAGDVNVIYITIRK